MSTGTIYQDWTGVTVTPQGGSAIPIPDITDVLVDATSVKEVFAGDLASLPQLIRTPAKTRKLRITGSAVGTLFAIPEDTPCSIVATLQSLGQGTGTGALTFTLVNAIRTQFQASGKANTPASSFVEFEAYSAAGTDPLTMGVA